jgi:tetratricopeptide (TPR) repeat protein
VPQLPRTPEPAESDLASALVLLDQLQPAIERGNRVRQNHIIEKLIELRAPMGAHWRELAQLAAENGELSLSRSAVDRCVEALAGNPVAQYFKAGMLAEAGFWPEGYALLRTLPDDVPNPADHAYSRGAAALYTGRLDEAREQLGRAIHLRPQLSKAWQLLASLTDFAREPKLADRLVDVGRAIRQAPPADRAGYHYALGKMHADRGEHTQAFAAVAEGARLMKRFVRYDREQDSFGAGEAVRGYSAQGLATVAGEQREPTARTIFVTGLARSGTTLVEQIVTSHSAVTDGAEINRLRLLAAEIGGLSFPDLQKYTEVHGAGEAARLWHHWLDERFPGSNRVVDKTINGSRFLGLAAGLLPEAPVIWTTRDPLDCAWSCFRTYFHSGVSWSYDLEDIAFHFRLEKRLLEEWRQILGERLLVVPHEALVADPEQWIRRILRHCGLDEQPQVFAPHRNERVVNTASALQVRQPINAGGIGSAEPYRPFLEPFLAAWQS